MIPERAADDSGVGSPTSVIRLIPRSPRLSKLQNPWEFAVPTYK